MSFFKMVLKKFGTTVCEFIFEGCRPELVKVFDKSIYSMSTQALRLDATASAA